MKQSKTAFANLKAVFEEYLPPMRKKIGDLSNKERVLIGFDLRPHNSSNGDGR